MLIIDPKFDAAFREYADLQFRRHQMLVAGKYETSEIADTEDRMDEIWQQLDEVQRVSLNGMASDLNWLRRNGEPAPNGRKSPEEVSETDLQGLIVVMDWYEDTHNEILKYLRLCAPRLSRVDLALLRGRAYNALQFPAYGSAFFNQAVEFAVANAHLEVAARGDRIEVGG